jgi:hypothetical protein
MFCTSKYQLKLGKCFECFILAMKVYVGEQWSIGIIVARRHELDTWHAKKKQTKNGMKPHQAQGLVKWSQLHVTHTTHDMSRKHICSGNYNVSM